MARDYTASQPQKLKGEFGVGAQHMSLRRNDHHLTLATQWANSVLRFALDHQLRGRALRMQATYQHRALHEPGFGTSRNELSGLML